MLKKTAQIDSFEVELFYSQLLGVWFSDVQQLVAAEKRRTEIDEKLAKEVYHFQISGSKKFKQGATYEE